MFYAAAVKLLLLNLLEPNDAELYERVPLIQNIWQKCVIFKTSISANLFSFKRKIESLDLFFIFKTF